MHLRLNLIILSFLSIAGCGGNSTTETRDLELPSGSITIDPYGDAPLSAQLQFEAPEPGVLSIRVLGKEIEGIDIYHSHDGLLSGVVNHPILGLYANHVNEVVIKFKGISGTIYEAETSIATQALPFDYESSIEIITNNIADEGSMVYMFSRQKFAFDSRGAVRWLYLGKSLDIFRKLPNGNLLADLDENTIRYHSPAFIEISMLGQEIRRYSIDNYLHHEVRRLPSGNYLVASNSSLYSLEAQGVPEEDVLLEVDSSTGAIVKSWDFNSILDPERPSIPSNNRLYDWLHLNSAAYDATDNSIYITSQKQSLVAKIDYETGQLLWILGAHEKWKESFQDKLLTAVNELGEPIPVDTVDFWPYGPHAVLPLSDGRLALYDNGSYRGWYGDESVPAESYSRAVEYKVDEANKTVQLSWEFSADRNIFTPSTGDIDSLGNTDGFLVGFAGRSADSVTPRVVEVDRSGSVIFEAVSLPGTQDYRVEKFDLYGGL